MFGSRQSQVPYMLDSGQVNITFNLPTFLLQVMEEFDTHASGKGTDLK